MEIQQYNPQAKTQANVDITKNVGNYFLRQGVAPSDVIEVLKKANYTVMVDGQPTKVKASAIAYYMDGVLAGKQSIIDKLNNGTLKYTKSKGVHSV